MKTKSFYRIFSTACALVASLNLWAAAPTGYYTACENKGGAALLQALRSVVGPHTTVSYDGLLTLYNTSDIKPNGKLWDMYSTKEWTPGQNQCGNYKLVGDCWNREHSFPKSWFGGASPMYSDAYHLYPTDGKVNGQRSNYPYGECASGTTLPSNGSVKALGKLGTSTFPGYSGKVFEPVDEYKGDFARSYFYMAAAYNDRIGSWSSDMLAGNAYPAFSGWATELLLKWHRMDPVSDKELARNEAVYAAQHNRNPFIDHPEMAEYIWGENKTQAWTSAAAAQPAIVSPVNGSTVDMGTVGVGVARTLSLNVKGTALNTDVTLQMTGTGFSVSPASLASTTVNRSTGAEVTVTLTAPATGRQTGTLTLKSGAVTSTVTIAANALDGLPATAPTDITDESFVAHWTYVGNADSNGCYRLTVKDAAGEDVDTYPRSVPAAAEQFLVDELAAETDYTYYIECQGLRSNVIAVRTSAPIPSVQILYDGELELVAEPGYPSQPEELLLDIENITAPVTFSVDAPFELSTDRNNWSTEVNVDPREDRIYIRIYGATEGLYHSDIRATTHGYYTDEAEVSGRISAMTTFVEDFEQPGSGNYSATEYNGTACKWLLDNAGVYNVTKEAFAGANYLRMGSNATSSITMATDKPDGAGTVTIQAAGWSPSDGLSTFVVEYSTDGGQNWTSAGETTIPTPASSTTKEYNQYTYTVNQTGNVRLRVRQTAGRRMCIDDIAVSNYRAGASDLYFGDDHGTGWDAWAVGAELNVSLEQPSVVTIYTVEGRTFISPVTIPQGLTAWPANPGLYIVVVGESTRRVLVK